MATKSLKKLAPAHKQKPGADAGPDGSIRTAKLYKAPSTNLSAGSSAYRGKGK